MPAPVVSVIIPHLQGEEILLRCLRSIFQQVGSPPFEVVVVDNASTDGSVPEAKRRFPSIRVVCVATNRGYAGGCNLGIRASQAPFVLLLNNDTILAPNLLAELLKVALHNPQVAAIQPKIRSISRKDEFDYAGAAGGFMDIFGFPFARGRLFFTIEKDYGQYDRQDEIFWASGTCTLLRRTALEAAGLLDESFFAHMEEIDLNWRLHLLGYRVLYAPSAVVFHDAGTTLRPESPRKILLNHRNSLLMLLKNYRASTLSWIFPIRLMLQVLAVIYVLAQRDFSQMRAILWGSWQALRFIPQIWAERRRIQRIRLLSDRQIRRRMYRNSVVLQYFLLGRKTFDQLGGADVC